MSAEYEITRSLREAAEAVDVILGKYTGKLGMSPREAEIIIYLDAKRGATRSEIIRDTRIAKPTVDRAMRSLIKRGYVQSKILPGPRSKTKGWVGNYTTAKGKTRASRARAQFRELERWLGDIASSSATFTTKLAVIAGEHK